MSSDTPPYFQSDEDHPLSPYTQKTSPSRGKLSIIPGTCTQRSPLSGEIEKKTESNEESFTPHYRSEDGGSETRFEIRGTK